VLVERQNERGGLAHEYVEIFEVAVHGAALTDVCTHRPPERSTLANGKKLGERLDKAGKGQNNEFVNVGNTRLGCHTADGERRTSAKHAHPLTMLTKALSSLMNTSAHEDRYDNETIVARA
jgi:hypothetical protein